MLNHCRLTLKPGMNKLMGAIKVASTLTKKSEEKMSKPKSSKQLAMLIKAQNPAQVHKQPTKTTGVKTELAKEDFNWPPVPKKQDNIEKLPESSRNKKPPAHDFSNVKMLDLEDLAKQLQAQISIDKYFLDEVVQSDNQGRLLTSIT